MEVAPSALARHAPGNLGLICAPSTRIVNRYEALALKFEPTSPVNNRRGGGTLSKNKFGGSAWRAPEPSRMSEDLFPGGRIGGGREGEHNKTD